MAELKNKKILAIGAGVITLAILWLIFRDHPALAAPSSGGTLAAQTPPQYAYAPPSPGDINIANTYDMAGAGDGALTGDTLPPTIPFTTPVRKTTGDCSSCCGDCGGCGKQAGPTTPQNLINDWSPTAAASMVIALQDPAPPQPPKYWQGYWTDQYGNYHYAPGYQPS